MTRPHNFKTRDGSVPFPIVLVDVGSEVDRGVGEDDGGAKAKLTVFLESELVESLPEGTLHASSFKGPQYVLYMSKWCTAVVHIVCMCVVLLIVMSCVCVLEKNRPYSLCVLWIAVNIVLGFTHKAIAIGNAMVAISCSSTFIVDRNEYATKL